MTTSKFSGCKVSILDSDNYLSTHGHKPSVLESQILEIMLK